MSCVSHVCVSVQVFSACNKVWVFLGGRIQFDPQGGMCTLQKEERSVSTLELWIFNSITFGLCTRNLRNMCEIRVRLYQFARRINTTCVLDMTILNFEKNNNKTNCFLFGVGVCPVLCSGHGHYGGGVCHCEESWKGPECDVPVGECQVPGCTGHGRCIEGECHCERGWKGQFCEQRKKEPKYSLAIEFINSIFCI